MSFDEIVLLSVMISVLPLAQVSFYFWKKLMVRLREGYSDVYSELGSPPVGLSSRRASGYTFRVWKWVLSGAHKELEDTEVSLHARLMLAASFLSTIAIFAMVIMIIIYDMNGELGL